MCSSVLSMKVSPYTNKSIFDIPSDILFTKGGTSLSGTHHGCRKNSLAIQMSSTIGGKEGNPVMKRYERNIRVIAINEDVQSGFNIYLEFSGKREYLVTHRHNGALYGLLKDGIRVADMQRLLYGSCKLQSINDYRVYFFPTKQLRNSMRHLMIVIDEYITDRAQCA